MDQVLALLLTDLVDSTAINARIGDAAMAELWLRHDQASRDLARRFGGREVDRSDGFLMVFAEAAEAARFAAAYHRMLAALPTPLAARAGLHVGTVATHEASDADRALGAKPFELVGIAKAMTARLMSLAQAGQTLLSAAAAAASAATPGLQCHSHGHWRFKGFEEPVEVFEIGDDASPFVPPPDSEKAHRAIKLGGQWSGLGDIPHTLPAERDSFFGRGDDLRRLARHFEAGGRLVVLHGPGGVGKTRLAQRYGWCWLGRYPGGAYFVDLSEATSVDGILHAAARGLGVPLGAAPLDQLSHVIEGREQCLVVLDNFERVALHARVTLGEWLDRTRHARFLVTSRESLGLVGEHTLPVAPLDAASATAMFAARAAAAAGMEGALGDDPGAVAALVDLLDRLPLALELAAARAPVLNARQMLDRMEARFRLLAGRAGRTPRQSTLRTTLDWSWESLTGSEREAMAQLAVFRGGFTLEDAHAVLQIDGGEWLPDLLQSLVGKSLLQFGPARFALLQSVQAYAQEQLSGREAGVTRRHWNHFATASEQDGSPAQDPDLENIVAACRSAAAAGDTEPAVACLLRAWLGLRRVGPFGVAAELAAALSPAALDDFALLQRVTWVAASARFAMGDMAATERLLQEALARAGPGADTAFEARLWALRTDALAAAGDLLAARECADRARAYLGRRLDTDTLCQIHNALGSLENDHGHLADARAFYEAGLAFAVAAADARWEGGLLGNIGLVHYAAGDLDAAADALARAAALAVEAGDRRWEGHARCNLGLVLSDMRRHKEALEQLQAAAATARSLGLRTLEATTTCNMGLALLAKGDAAAACETLTQAAERAGALRDKALLVSALCGLAPALARHGLLTEARRRLAEAQALLPDLEVHPERVIWLCSGAEVAHWAADDEQFGAGLEAARTIAARLPVEQQPALQRRLAEVYALPQLPRLTITGS